MSPQLTFAFLQAIMTMAANPAITGPQNAALVQALTLGLTLLRRGQRGYAELQALTEEVQRMVIENRTPNEQELDVWRQRSDSAHDRIQSYGKVPPPVESPTDQLGQIPNEYKNHDPLDGEPDEGEDNTSPDK